jgi:hypothetical protein
MEGGRRKPGCSRERLRQVGKRWWTRQGGRYSWTNYVAAGPASRPPLAPIRYCRLAADRTLPAIGPIPVLQWVSTVVTIIVLFPLSGVAGTRRCGGVSESRSGNERSQCHGGEKRLHDTSPCYGSSSDHLRISAAVDRPALCVVRRVRKVDRGRQCLFPGPHTSALLQRRFNTWSKFNMCLRDPRMEPCCLEALSLHSNDQLVDAGCGISRPPESAECIDLASWGGLLAEYQAMVIAVGRTRCSLEAERGRRGRGRAVVGLTKASPRRRRASRHDS